MFVCCRMCPFAIMHRLRFDYAWVIHAFVYSRVCVLVCKGTFAGMGT